MYKLLVSDLKMLRQVFTHLFSLGILLLHFRPCDNTLENSYF